MSFNPIVSIIFVLCSSVVIVTNSSTMMFLVYLLVGLLLFFNSKFTVRYLLMIVVFTLLFTVFNFFYRNLFISDGEVFMMIGKIVVYKSAVDISVFLFFRVICLVLITSSVMSFITSYQFGFAFEYLLSFFNIFGLNSKRFAMILMLALKFIPILSSEASKINKAQILRGKRVTGISKFYSYMYLFVPLLFTSFKRADNLALAMDIKGYDADQNYTRFERFDLMGRDRVLIGIILIIMVILVAIF